MKERMMGVQQVPGGGHGGDEPTPPPAGEEQQQEQGGEQQQDGEQGPKNPDAYTKALQAERDRADAAERELKRFKDAEEQARKESLPERQRLLEEAVEAAKAEVRAEYEARLLQARVEAKASGRFVDPALAVSLLEVAADATDEQIQQALDALAEARPYLLAAPGSGQVPPISQGTRGGSGSQATQDGNDWIRGMYRQKMDA